MHHWYLSFWVCMPDGTWGMRSIGLTNSKPLFSIQAVQQTLIRALGAKVVTIISWQPITAEQYTEIRVEGEHRVEPDRPAEEPEPKGNVINAPKALN